MQRVFIDMGDFIPKTPIELQIRQIIHDKFNDTEIRFTNDEIFEDIQKNGDIDSTWIIDDMEKYFQNICDTKMTRNIAQNFTTIWLKIFEPIEQMHCHSCNHDICLGKSEKRICPNPDCKSSI